LTEICNTGASSTPTGINCTNLIDLSALVPTYLVAIPTDPQGSLSFLDSIIPTAYAITNGTGYLVALNSASKPYLEADNAELNQITTIGNINGVMPDRLAAYWSFDDVGSGTALDSAGTNHGTVSGPTATTGVKSLSNTAYGFDGVSDYIDLTNVAIGQNSSVSFWFKPSSTATSLIFSNNRNLTESFAIFFNGGRLYLTNDSYDGVMSNTTLTTNQWYYAVFNIPSVNDSSTPKLYLNGVNVTSVAHSQTFDPFTATRIGSTSATFCYNGIIDNFRVYNKVLTLDKIMNIYNTEKP
jgi:hypothetical protein